MSKYRIDRINEEIKRDLAGILRQIKDPRVPEFVSIIDVKTTPDLRYCKVYVSFLDQTDEKEAIKGLNSSAGFVRREIGAKVKMHYTPEISFIPDDSIRHGVKIARMIDNLKSKDE